MDPPMVRIMKPGGETQRLADLAIGHETSGNTTHKEFRSRFAGARRTDSVLCSRVRSKSTFNLRHRGIRSSQMVNGPLGGRVLERCASRNQHLHVMQVAVPW